VTKGQTRREECAISEQAWRRFSHALDSDPVKVEERLVVIRRKLILYFSKGLGSIKQGDPEDLAHKTICRMARKIGEEGVKLTSTIEHYCFGVAFHVLQEYWDEATTARDKERPIDLASEKPMDIGDYFAQLEKDEQLKRDEQSLACLEQCLEKHFSKLEIAAILNYHDVRQEPGQTKQIRKALALRLKTSPKNLSNNMDRHRDKLLACIEICLEGGF
jgi:DNA-directed RNA polymerase specialized sigma24 family protein